MAVDRSTDGKNPVRAGASVLRVDWRDRLTAALDHHRASARDALRRMRSNRISGLMTVLVMAVALSLPAALYVLLDNVRALSGHVDSQAQISLFLKKEVSEQAQRALANRLGRHEDVLSVAVITREQALAEFRAQSGYADVLDTLADNPLPGVLVVLPKDTALAAGLRDALAAEAQVEIAQLDSAWLQKLAAILNAAERLAKAFGVAFALMVLLVVVNTIRLSMESRRDEILVVKLVGATDAFVRRPFLYTGFWFGLAGGLGAVLLVTLLIGWIATPVSLLVSLYQSTFVLAGLGVGGSLTLIGVGTLLGVMGAWVAVLRHLREIEPH